MYNPPLRVVAAVIQRDNTLLACRRGPGRRLAGKWEFPGGKVEDGESDRAALVREIQEELAVEVRVDGHITTDDWTAGEQTIRLACYACSLVAAEPSSSTDHDQIAWISETQLRDYDWAPADLPAVALLAR